MTYRPHSVDRKAPLFAALCALFAVASFSFSAHVSHAALVYQLAALVLAVTALEVYLKYVACDYLYKAGENELMVYRITGKKSICVCSLSYEESVSNVVDAAHVSKNSAQFPRYRLAVNACKNLFPKEYALYYFNFNGKVARLKFEPDADFIRHVNQKIHEAESRKTDE